MGGITSSSTSREDHHYSYSQTKGKKRSSPKISSTQNLFTAKRFTGFPSPKSSRKISCAPLHGSGLDTPADGTLDFEISSIRKSIRTNGTIIPQEKIIFILFAPPEYPTVNAAEFLSSKIQLPVIYPHEYRVENRQPIRRQDSSSSSQLNMTTRTLLRQSSAVQDEKDTRTRLTECIYRTISEEDPLQSSTPSASSGDCKNGFILFEYPDTISEMRYFKENIVPGYRVELIFLQLTNETMRALQYKFDRWVHPPSRRSYHMIYCPPRTIAVDLLPPSAENMRDDITGEALVQETDDLPETFKERLFQYQLREIPMFYEFEDCAHEVPGGISQDDVHKYLLRVVYNLTVNHLRNKYSTASVSTAVAATNTSSRFSLFTSA